MIPYFTVLAGPGGSLGLQGSGGTTTSFGDWLGDIPIIGPLLEFLTEASVALVNGLEALWEAKDVIFESISWLPVSVGALILSALTVIITMKLFGR